MCAFVVGFVPGVTPRKWFRTWTERGLGTPLEGLRIEEHEQWESLASARARMAFVRQTTGDRRPEGMHLIPLYEEEPVVVVPVDHFVTAGDEVTYADIADELAELPDPMTWQDRVAVVAGGAGLTVVPQSVAREFHRKDLAWRRVVDLPGTTIGLAWPMDDGAADPLVEAFIGIVRGRTAQSSRGPGEGGPPAPRPAARPAAQKRAGTPSRRPARRGRGRR